MYWKYSLATVVRFVVVVAVLGAFSGPYSGVATAGDNSVIKLALDEVGNGIAMVRANPRDAKIWRSDPEKPQRVLWWMIKNRTSYPEIMFEIRFDSPDDAAGEDFFGDVVLGCGAKDVTVQPQKTPDTAGAEWPYSITAYACRDGVRAQKIATLESLKVVWQD